MWPRKQLDIRWKDYAYGFWQTFNPSQHGPTTQSIVQGWIPTDEALVSLSVRSGFDLLLTSLQLPAGSEVLMTAVTIPDMERIVKHHRLVPVPINIEADRLEISTADLQQSITPQTRAIVVAHLFGCRLDMAPVIQLAHQHGLLVIEDCAQAFIGKDYAGHEKSDVCMFSFGPIKTATALGGAILRVRDVSIRESMQTIQKKYPIQRRWNYLARLAKYAIISLVSNRHLYGFLVICCRKMGVDYDQIIGDLIHGFDKSNFFDQIRKQPTFPLLQMMRRRIQGFDRHGKARLRRRKRIGKYLAKRMPCPKMVPGSTNESHSYWVLPVRTAYANQAVATLRQAGFDATQRSSLCIIGSSTNSDPKLHLLNDWLKELIFLPNTPEMPGSECRRMRSVLLTTVDRATPQQSRSDSVLNRSAEQTSTL